METKVLETQHLLIRPSVWEDLVDFSKWERMPEVTKFFSIHDEQTDEECAVKFLEDQNNPKAEQFTIQLKPDAYALKQSAARNLDHYTGNPAAFLDQSLGFQYEGVLRKNCRKNGILYDVHLMSMLRDEYEAKYKVFSCNL